ncbi:hypothetical protein NP493_446g03006 [Ridgeia piscesae]|uniref:Uncharacterized protein n=1 Tax=Ridgeia piscesae TaxID=27915 RepID=A0AAD9NTR4_RIDPI|nr:hypothetical protein NP493_446g03006 [Ridgeia piscesae]
MQPCPHPKLIRLTGKRPQKPPEPTPPHPYKLPTSNLRHDFYNNSQKGLWSNAKFNTPGAVYERPGYVGTYSNLHGNWSRFGPSTYDSIHGNGNWVFNWPIGSVEPASYRGIAESGNINPRDDLVPIEDIPQNMRRKCATGVIIQN